MLKIILILIIMSTNSYAYDIGTAMYWSNQAKDQQLDQQYKQQKIEEQRLKNEKLRQELKLPRKPDFPITQDSGKLNTDTH